MDGQELNRLITEAYSRDLEKPELVSFKDVTRWSRKFGFPLVCCIANKSEAEIIHWAASLLVEVAKCWPREDMPELMTPVPGSALAYDARRLIENGLGAIEQLEIELSKKGN